MSVSRRCARHGDRPAYALCMTCSRALCQECATTWDGIHYCNRCLAQRRTAERTSSSVMAWIAFALLIPFLLWLQTRLIVWAGVLAVEIQ